MYVQYKEIRNSFLMILYFVDVITKCSMQPFLICICIHCLSSLIRNQHCRSGIIGNMFVFTCLPIVEVILYKFLVAVILYTFYINCCPACFQKFKTILCTFYLNCCPVCLQKFRTYEYI